MSSEQGPVARLLAAAWAVFFACLLLWLAVWLIEQIWVWLLIIAAVVAVVSALLWLRRRSRW